MPSSRWLGGNGVDGHEFFAPEAIASGGNGDKLFNGVEVRVLHELFVKLLKCDFQEFDIHRVSTSLRIIHFFGWHGSFVMLVLLRVEFVREETLTQFSDSEGGREVGQRKRQETQRVFESQSF